MSRFYRTSSATPLDYMYQANIPLMQRVIETNDRYIDQNLAGLDKLDQLSNYDHLIGDEEDAAKISKGYKDKVEELTRAIQSDPANWRKQLDPIRSLSKDLQTNYESGAISKHLFNYQQRKKAFDAVDKQVELYHTSGGEKGVDPTRAAAYKKHWDDQFDKTDYNPQLGTYNTYKGGSVMDNMNIKKVLSEGLDKIKADKSYQYHEDEAGNGWYLNKVTQKIEQITPERVLSIAMGNINPQMKQYLAEDSKVGLIKGVYNENGDFIAPYSYSEVGITPDEQKKIEETQRGIDAIKKPAIKKQLQDALDRQIEMLKARQQFGWNEQSYLAPILRGLVNTYSYKDVESGNDLSNNSKGSTIYNANQAWARQTRSLSQARELANQRERGLNDRLEKNLAFRKWQWENPHEKGGSKTSSKSSGAKKDKGEEEEQIETSVGRMANNSFESWMTTDKTTGKNVPVLSIAGLSNEIDNKKRQLTDIDTRIKEADKILLSGVADSISKNKATVEKNRLTKQRDLVQSDLNDRRNWYKTSVEATLTNHKASGVNLTPEEIKLYKEYEKDKGGSSITKQINAKNEEVTKLIGSRIEVTGTKWDKMSVGERQKVIEYNQKLPDLIKQKKEEAFQLQQKLDKLIDTKAKVDLGRDNFLKELRKDIIDSDAINLGTKDKATVGKQLFSNTTGYELFDGFGNATASVELEGKGISWFAPTEDNFNMSFADGSLKRYIDRYNVGVNVHRIANSTKIGNGNAVAEVTFDDPTGNIKKNKTYYITLTPEMQRDIGNRFKNHANPEVVGIANQFLDDEGNNIRRQLMRPHVNRVIGNSDGEESGQFKIHVKNSKGNTVPLNVTSFTEGGMTHFHITNEKGEELPNIDGTSGFFNGIEDVVRNLKKK